MYITNIKKYKYIYTSHKYDFKLRMSANSNNLKKFKAIFLLKKIKCDKDSRNYWFHLLISLPDFNATMNSLRQYSHITKSLFPKFLTLPFPLCIINYHHQVTPPNSISTLREPVNTPPPTSSPNKMYCQRLHSRIKD